jgi:Domain of unknown function (DUF4424)
MIRSFIALSLTLLTQPLFANGGGYLRGGVERTGDVAGFEPSATEKIQILDEKLTISLGPHSADVEVRYLMRNETNKKVKVRFGFPVEEIFDEDNMRGEPTTDDAIAKINSPKYCQNYTITAAGKVLKSKWQVEEKAPNPDKQFKGIAGWLISEITFSAGEEKPVMIRFKSGYPFESWSVSDDTSESAALFRYRLSTAACWAGTIGSGQITLKPAGIDPRELKVLKPVNRFKKEGRNWVWNFENLEPALADDLEIEAVPEMRSHNHTETSCHIERGQLWLMSHTNYTVKASSVLPATEGQTYDAENIKNFWTEKTWSEGKPGPGIGEWLEIKPISPKPINRIEIQPGFSKSEALFKANSRPRKIKIAFNDDHQFTVDIPDNMEACSIPISGYTKPVKKIRLTFLEVWPGNKFEDLCVSGVRLQVKLDQKPTIAPVR